MEAVVQPAAVEENAERTVAGTVTGAGETTTDEAAVEIEANATCLRIVAKEEAEAETVDRTTPSATREIRGIRASRRRRRRRSPPQI